MTSVTLTVFESVTVSLDCAESETGSNFYDCKSLMYIPNLMYHLKEDGRKAKIGEFHDRCRAKKFPAAKIFPPP